MTVVPRPIRRVLIANRGEIAVRIIEACRALGIETVGVYAEPDRDGLHVHEADVAVALGGTSATETYLDQAKLLDAALTQGCDAVHPGYGFLSESPGFARAVTEAGMTWIGPHARGHRHDGRQAGRQAAGQRRGRAHPAQRRDHRGRRGRLAGPGRRRRATRC